jgi:hypothetical protein
VNKIQAKEKIELRATGESRCKQKLAPTRTPTEDSTILKREVAAHVEPLDRRLISTIADRLSAVLIAVSNCVLARIRSRLVSPSVVTPAMLRGHERQLIPW